MKNVPLSRDQAEALIHIIQERVPEGDSRSGYFAHEAIEVIAGAFGISDEMRAEYDFSAGVRGPTEEAHETLLLGHKGDSFLSTPMVPMGPEEFSALLKAPEALNFKQVFAGPGETNYWWRPPGKAWLNPVQIPHAPEAVRPECRCAYCCYERDDPPQRYVVSYPAGVEVSIERLRALLNEAGDDMATVEKV